MRDVSWKQRITRHKPPSSLRSVKANSTIADIMTDIVEVMQSRSSEKWQHNLLDEGTDGVVPDHAQERVPHIVLIVVRALWASVSGCVLPHLRTVFLQIAPFGTQNTCKQFGFDTHVTVVHGFGVLCFVVCRCEMCKNLLFCHKLYSGWGHFHQKGPKSDMIIFYFGSPFSILRFPRKTCTHGKQGIQNAKDPELAGHALVKINEILEIERIIQMEKFIQPM